MISVYWSDDMNIFFENKKNNIMVSAILKAKKKGMLLSPFWFNFP